MHPLYFVYIADYSNVFGVYNTLSPRKADFFVESQEQSNETILVGGSAFVVRILPRLWRSFAHSHTVELPSPDSLHRWGVRSRMRAAAKADGVEWEVGVCVTCDAKLQSISPVPANEIGSAERLTVVN